MTTPWYDVPSVHLVLHALARAEHPVTVADLAATTGLGEQTVKSKLGGARRRIAEVPGASIRRAGRGTSATVVLVGMSQDDVERLVGPPAGESYTYLGFSRSKAVLVRALVEAGGRAVSALWLGQTAYPGAQSRAAALGRIREAVPLIVEARRAAGERTGPVRRDSEGSEGYAWDTLAEAAPSETALETAGQRVSLPSVAGVYVFTGGQLYRDGHNCATTTDRV